MPTGKKPDPRIRLRGRIELYRKIARKVNIVDGIRFEGRANQLERLMLSF